MSSHHHLARTGLEVLIREADAEPVIVYDLADAGLLAFDLFGLGLTKGALVLLDAHRSVVAVMHGPRLSIEQMLRFALEPALRTEFHQVIGILVRDRITSAPPTDADVAKYRDAQSACAEAGVLWLDLLLANPHALQSIGIVCDPDSVWLDPIGF